MRGSTTEFLFAKASSKSNEVRDGNGKGLSVTSKTGADQVTMFMDRKMNLHEPRHGGQVARREYNFDENGNPSSSYVATHELSAYNAEYAFRGKLSFTPFVDLSNPMNLLLLGQGALNQTITNMNDISTDLLREMVDQPGIKQQYIYRNNSASWWAE